MILDYLKGNVLDIGCFNAYILSFLTDSQAYIGIDANEELIDSLRQENRRQKTYFHRRDVERENLPRFDIEFETILMIALIEHLRDAESILEQCYQLLKDNGHLVITTPTPMGDKFHRIGAKLGLTSKEAVQEHHRIYSYKDMAELLTKTGFYIHLYRKFEFGMNQTFVARIARLNRKGRSIEQTSSNCGKSDFRDLFGKTNDIK